MGAGYYLLLEAPLLISGIIMAYDGLKWYLPARALFASLPPLRGFFEQLIAEGAAWNTGLFAWTARRFRRRGCRSALRRLWAFRRVAAG